MLLYYLQFSLVVNISEMPEKLVIPPHVASSKKVWLKQTQLYVII